MANSNIISLNSNRKIKINFDGGDLSSDAGLLLIKSLKSKKNPYTKIQNSGNYSEIESQSQEVTRENTMQTFT